jgi:hypothetical protein
MRVGSVYHAAGWRLKRRVRPGRSPAVPAGLAGKRRAQEPAGLRLACAPGVIDYHVSTGQQWFCV